MRLEPHVHMLFAKVFFIALVVAAISNGSVFWLKRVGILEPQMHQTYYKKYHHGPEYKVSSERLEEIRVFAARLYKAEGIEVVSKVAKDVVALLFVSVPLLMAGRDRKIPAFHQHWVVYLFFPLLAFAFVRSFHQFGPLLPAAGLRSFLFLPVAVLGAWATSSRSLDFLARCLFVFLLVQLALVPYELYNGIHLFRVFFFGTHFGDRVVGTMLQPSSLGVTAVMILAYCLAFSTSRALKRFIVAPVCCVVYFTASATALILLVVILLGIVMGRVGTRYRRWALRGGLVLFSLVVVCLPGLTGREDIYDSVSGRIELFREHIAGFSASELIFGKGLGIGTNTAANLFMNWQKKVAPGYGEQVVFVADSTPLNLFAQTGMVGLLLFYAMLLKSAWEDRQTCLVYLVAGAASLTINITELFPVNMMLGLLLARSMSRGTSALPGTD